MFMGIITLIFLVCSLRTNIAFVILFFSLVLAFELLAAAFFLNADNITGNASTSSKLVVVSRTRLIIVCVNIQLIFTGRWSLSLRHFAGRMVDFRRADARCR